MLYLNCRISKALKALTNICMHNGSIREEEREKFKKYIMAIYSSNLKKKNQSTQSRSSIPSRINTKRYTLR